jgi:hypothetical protein
VIEEDDRIDQIKELIKKIRSKSPDKIQNKRLGTAFRKKSANEKVIPTMHWIVAQIPCPNINYNERDKQSFNICFRH